ncbi:MAG TPA: GntR family transcriptional regulator [Solirubrobacteraceae bacterium]|jgi:DNA-binding GntR family transcriptional regulator
MTDNSRPRTLKPVEHHRLADQAHEAIRGSILAGGFEPGERLVETRLASDLGMSRAPIREALQRLSKEGLVLERAHRGTFVLELGVVDIIDIYNLRLGLEATGLRLFMKRGATTTKLWTRIEQMERAADRDDIAAIVRAEFAFHRYIAEEAGNPFLTKVFSELEGRLMLVIAIDDAAFLRLHDVPAEHVPVVEAIETGDELRAVTVFEEHLLSTVGAAIERLGGDVSLLLRPLRREGSRASSKK